MTLQFTPTVLRMTKPMVSVPPPRQLLFDERGTAMYELENKIVHPDVEERFHDRNMDLDLISSISGFLKFFSEDQDHDFFIRLTNAPEAVDTDHYKIRNLIALTPPEVFEETSPAHYKELRKALRIMNGLSVWGIRTDNELVTGYKAVQAHALMYVTAMTQYTMGVEMTSHWISNQFRYSTLFQDPELADLVMEFPQHHRLITDTILSRESSDIDLLRSVINDDALALTEGIL